MNRDNVTIQVKSVKKMHLFILQKKDSLQDFKCTVYYLKGEV